MYQSLKTKIDLAFPEGILTIPAKARGLIIFCLGSANSQYCPRTHYLAQQFQRSGLATFVFDMLPREGSTNHIEDAGKHLTRMTQLLMKRSDVRDLPVAYFSTAHGTAVAFHAAAVLRHKIATIVSCSGRPDMAADDMPLVEAPVLLMVEQFNPEVVTVNRQALHHLSGTENLVIIIKDTHHLLDESGALEQVSQLSTEWLVRNLSGRLAMQEQVLKSA